MDGQASLGPIPSCFAREPAWQRKLPLRHEVVVDLEKRKEAFAQMDREFQGLVQYVGPVRQGSPGGER
eukprot:8321891-Lingulodinium_polyedra.AAC.1